VLGEYKPARDLLLLDGIPRTLEQAKIMDDRIEVLGIVYLTCNDEEAMIHRLRRRALKENRFDDADESVIRNRWTVYADETEPVLDHYDRGLIHEVGAVGTPAHVLRDVLNAVMPIQEKHFEKFM